MSCNFTKTEILKVLSDSKLVECAVVGDSKIACTGIEYDSRLITGGQCFVALRGDKTHGHEFVQSAYNQGASLILVEDKKFLNTDFKDHIVYVNDTLKAFTLLASYYRKKLNIPCLAITGSVGKTTTKEICASLLIQLGAGCYAQKSFNNHVGVPYTILQSSPSHKWMVLEIGMNKPGEISRLSQIACPDVCIVTEVAASHIGAFEDGLKGIAQEKLSIIAGSKEGSFLIVNGDNSYIQQEIKDKNLNSKYQIIKVGYNQCNDFIVSNVTNTAIDCIKFTVNNSEFELLTPGLHNAINGAIAYVAVKKLCPEINESQIKQGFNRFTAPLMRLNLKVNKKGVHIFDDSYNANPASMKAMLDIARHQQSLGKKISLILGTMLELGKFAEQYHYELGQQVAELTPENVVLVGEFSEHIKNGILSKVTSDKIRIYEATCPESAGTIASSFNSDMIFVKASRAIALDQTVKVLMN